eukprot:3527845-Prorocentrum_lima.AAC.1
MPALEGRRCKWRWILGSSGFNDRWLGQAEHGNDVLVLLVREDGDTVRVDESAGELVLGGE